MFQVQVPQLRQLAIGDDASMDPNAYRGLAGAIGKAHVQEFVLIKNGLTEPKLQAFGDAAEQDKVELQTLGVGDDESMDPDAYHGLAGAIKKAHVQAFILENNGLTQPKLQAFGDIARQDNLELDMLCISNETSLNDECYEEIIRICTKANCELWLNECNVSDEREQALNTRIRDVSVDNE